MRKKRIVSRSKHLSAGTAIIWNFIGCVSTLLRVLASVNKFISRDRVFSIEKLRARARVACVPSELTFSRSAGTRERRTGVESYGTSHVSYANSRHPEITPVYQTERGVRLGSVAIAQR